MAVLFAPWGNQQLFDDSGNPATGWKIYTYAANSSTPLASYTTSTGNVAQSNPIVIDSLGFPAVGQIWLTSGLAYKMVLTNALNVVKKTEDNITGVTGTSTVSQWTASGLTPTYVSATSFTLAGDQTSDFHLQRRLQSTTTAGTIYSTITGTAYTTLTTVTVSNDSGVLDSGLSSVSLGFLTATNPSVPASYAKSGPLSGSGITGAAASGANSDITSLSGLTTALSVAQGGTSGATPALARAALSAAVLGANGDITSLSGLTTGISGLGLGSKIQSVAASIASSALTCTLNATSLDFRSPTLSTGTVNTRMISAAISVVVPSTATLGTVSAVASRLVLIALDNAGTVELAIVNIAGGNNLDETTLISTTAISASATSSSTVYSTTARTSLPFRVVGYVDSTQATAGTWATSPSTVQGLGGQALAAMSSLGYGQTWQNLTASRAVATTYYNATGKPIFVSVTCGTSTANSTINLNVNGVLASASYQPSGTSGLNVSAVVPPGQSYSVTVSGGTPGLNYWAELR